MTVISKLRKYTTWGVLFFFLVVYYYRKRKQKLSFAELIKNFANNEKNYFLAITWKSQLIYQDSFKHSEQYHQDTIFRLFDIGRIFVATGIVLCVEKGILSLDEKVSTYIPSVQSSLTIKQLMRMRSGYVPRFENPHAEESIFLEENKNVLKLDEFLKTLATTKNVYKPNTQVNPNGCDYDLLCEILNVATKMNFNDFLQKHIFQPLLMEDTKLTINKNALYRVFKNIKARDVFIESCDGYFSTTTDLLRFLECIQNDGILDNVSVIHPLCIALLRNTIGHVDGLESFSEHGIYASIDFKRKLSTIMISQEKHTNKQMKDIISDLNQSISTFCNLHQTPPMYSPVSLARLNSAGL